MTTNDATTGEEALETAAGPAEGLTRDMPARASARVDHSCANKNPSKGSL